MSETAPATAEVTAQVTAQVIDLRRYRLARLIRNASGQQNELARLMRASVAERTQLAEALQGAQRHLSHIADSYKVLLVRLKREKDFRDACQEAAELDDLDEMIRRRDSLVRELERIRVDRRIPLGHPGYAPAGAAVDGGEGDGTDIPGHVGSEK